MYKEDVIEYIKETYDIDPVCIFKNDPITVVFRHKTNKKWIAIIMNITGDKVGLESDEYVDVMNVKCEPDLVAGLKHSKGYAPAYHMNHSKWLSIILDGSLPRDNVCNLIDMSYDLTLSKASSRKKIDRGMKEWLIPSNPKYYDVVTAFEKNRVIDWKQSSSIIPGDIVYMYLAAPYSSIRYKCRAVETDIPYNDYEGILNIKKLMKIELLEVYDKAPVNLEVMKEYGVGAVRGPRYMPDALIARIERMYKKKN